MKTLFDVRQKKNDEMYQAIQELFDEPLKIIEIDQPIHACIGCWSCWLKTPGRCVMKDQMSEIYSDYMNSDTVILLLDTAQGFLSHQAKAFFDRLIPHYHPYIKIVDAECHHVTRYEKYPDLVFHFKDEGLTHQEDKVIEDYLYRMAYQFQSKAYRIDDNFRLNQLQSRKAKSPSANIVPSETIDKLVIYNGSPRKNKSNSTIILNKVSEVLGDRVEVRDLKQTDMWDRWIDSFLIEKNVMFFMPLYVHAMPSHVMEFIERLYPSQGCISFFVQSGFPESSQSHYLVAYFEQLALRLGRTYIGTAIKGGVEGLQMRPAAAQEKMIQPMVNAIVNLVNDGCFKQNDLQQLAIPHRLSKWVVILFKVFSLTGLTNYFWNIQLKENNAYEKRFDQPYRL